MDWRIWAKSQLNKHMRMYTTGDIIYTGYYRLAKNKNGVWFYDAYHCDDKYRVYRRFPKGVKKPSGESDRAKQDIRM